MTDGQRHQALTLSWLAMLLSGFVSISGYGAAWVIVGTGLFLVVFWVVAVTGHIRDGRELEQRERESRRAHLEAMRPAEVTEPARTEAWPREVLRELVSRWR